MLGRRVVGGLALCAALLMPAGAVMAQADTEVAGSFDSEAGGSLDASASADDGADEYVPWFIGPYWRHVWFPSYTGDVFLDRAPSVSNNGFGLLFTYRDEGGFSLVIGAGYTPYEFEGAFLGPGKPDEDTEWVTSDLALWHITGSVLWPINFHEMLTLEIGIGLDLGLLAGDIIRTEAVRESLPDGRFVPCTGPLNPNTVGNDARVPFCDTPAELDPGTEGEHYGVREDRVPPVFGMPFLPQLALRFAPHRYIAVKAEFGFSVVQMFAGATLQIGFGLFTQSKAAQPPPEPEPVGPPKGRVLGVVMEADSKLPIQQATVKPLNRALAPMSSMEDGRFIVSDLDPGLVRFEVSAAGYVTATCEVEIAPQGGDSALHCVLAREAVAGAISGQVRDGNGNAVPGVKIQVTGPYQGVIEPDVEGLFAAVDLPPGTYRLQAEAPGYYPQVTDVQLLVNDTATPQITLIKKPEQELVEVKSTEIVIRQQVNFASGKAVIERSSEELLRQIRDVFIRFPNIKLVEIQGHTDSKGSHDLNMKLSQDRADAVRDWLLQAGIEPSRMVARGYGPEFPLTSNDTAANRAKNRRVQFIIKEQVQ